MSEIKKYDDLLEMMPEGKENAISGEELAILMNTSKREISKLVHLARKEGFMIISDNHGYYTASCPEEVLRCYERLRKHSISQLSAMKAFRKYLIKHNLLEGGESNEKG